MKLTQKVVKDTKTKYQALLDKTRYEVKEAIQKTKKTQLEVKRSKEAWKERENQLVEHNRLVELKIEYAKGEIAKSVITLKEGKSNASKEKDEIESMKGKSVTLKQRLLNKERELQNILQKNKNLKSRSVTSFGKIE